ncbi:hypothetical protein SDC9_07413 [bioreactor metagenome]|uniref:Uncharacterized protein n=1 Tax=bioreactor metagenome TaxID=1076179 RepID=A0A644T4T3_9ZZZZ|nr:hypothetical protein [Methanobrevibacter sp.]MEA4956868.1 hypothetical protein [Methanobrevibacter sp.]
MGLIKKIGIIIISIFIIYIAGSFLLVGLGYDLNEDHYLNDTHFRVQDLDDISYNYEKNNNTLIINFEEFNGLETTNTGTLYIHSVKSYNDFLKQTDNPKNITTRKIGNTTVKTVTTPTNIYDYFTKNGKNFYFEYSNPNIWIYLDLVELIQS